MEMSREAREKKREYQREWRKKNPDYMKNWRRDNPKAVQEHTRRYWEKVAAEEAQEDAQ